MFKFSESNFPWNTWNSFRIGFFIKCLVIWHGKNWSQNLILSCAKTSTGKVLSIDTYIWINDKLKNLIYNDYDNCYTFLCAIFWGSFCSFAEKSTTPRAFDYYDTVAWKPSSHLTKMNSLRGSHYFRLTTIKHRGVPGENPFWFSFCYAREEKCSLCVKFLYHI